MRGNLKSLYPRSKFNKKGAGALGTVGGVFLGAVAIVIILAIMLIFGAFTIQIFSGTNLSPAGSAGANASNSIAGNGFAGINTIATYLPTISVIFIAVGFVLLFGVIVAIIYRVSSQSGAGYGGSI